ncbi:MAG: DUF3556 domain-containing protein [Kofleriaceae bacterium]|nr:DUF3556 domain-containing protein [Myxococcales bacterium]MCB9562893.1 DUF3556 domain-containing protein [Kofleriaceae bacterium]MCB9572730.1 DUF3556 domain-containing protein [Kofleriaceae bacterium]
MPLLAPTPTPYDPLVWVTRPFSERARQVCDAWALDGYGAPIAIYGVYLIKIALYVGGWLLWCGFTPGLGGIATIGDWWLAPVAFEKAIVWSLLFEGLGLGCGSGPLTGRYLPPLGGFLYFLRPGTTKRARFPSLPVVGGIRRSRLDVALYAALIAACVRALVAAAPGTGELLPIVVLVGALGVVDRTIFLALRAEHYGTTLVVLVAATGDDWIAGAEAVQLALWCWAGVSKLNHHFPSVVGVMVSNSPLTRMRWLRTRMYRAYPDDLRPSRLAVAMAHAGTALELGVPLVLAFAAGGPALTVGLILMLVLHGFITSNVPMGVPLEWNVMVVYGGFALFGAHPDVSVLDLGATPLAGFLAIVLVGVPLVGNLWPHRVSFLLAMRYYAGNWPYSVWLFRGDSYRKLDRLTKSSPWIYDQLAPLYDRATAVGLVGKVMGFRMMHLQGRALPVLIPRAVDRLEEHEYVDGEIVAGLALGWNFGDGHLHDEGLLAAIQAQCGFEPGELRCVFVEAQPLGGRTLAYRIRDAATGELDAGTVDVDVLRERQPWAAS